MNNILYFTDCANEKKSGKTIIMRDLLYNNPYIIFPNSNNEFYNYNANNIQTCFKCYLKKQNDIKRKEQLEGIMSFPLGLNKVIYNELKDKLMQNYNKYKNRINDKYSVHNESQIDIFKLLFEDIEYIYKPITDDSYNCLLLVKYHILNPKYSEVLEEFLPKDIIYEICKYLYKPIYLMIEGSRSSGCDSCGHGEYEDECIEKLYVHNENDIGLLLDTFTVYCSKIDLIESCSWYLNDINDWTD